MGGKAIKVGSVENGSLILGVLNIDGKRYFKVKCLTCGEITKSLRPRKHKSCSCGNRLKNANKVKDLTGMRFGRLVVLSYHDSQNNSARWLCQCDCGNQCIASSNNLKHSGTTSCGCAKKEQEKILLEKVHKNLHEIHMTQGTVTYTLTRKVNAGRELPKGVFLKNKRYESIIGFRKKRYYLGRYNTVNEAHAARLAAEELLFKPVLNDEIVPDYTQDDVRNYAEQNAHRFLENMKADDVSVK